MQTQNFHQRANYSPNSFHHCSPPIITSISFHDVRPKFSRWQNDTHSRQTWPLFSGETSAGKIERKIVFLCRLLVPSCRWCCVRVCIIKQFTSLPNSRLCTVPRPANWWRSRKVRVCVSVCVCCSWSGLNCHTIECRTLTPCGTLFFGALGEHIGLPLPSFLHCNFRPHTQQWTWTKHIHSSATLSWALSVSTFFCWQFNCSTTDKLASGLLVLPKCGQRSFSVVDQKEHSKKECRKGCQVLINRWAYFTLSKNSKTVPFVEAVALKYLEKYRVQ